MSSGSNSELPVRTQPVPGEFPFRLLGSEKESIYVTRLRDYSSYLTFGGLLTGLDAVACYVRGILGNLLIILPILLIAGCLLGLSHFFILSSPLFISTCLLVILAVCALAFFVLDSVNCRWDWVRIIPRSAILFLIIAAFTECSPLVIEFFRKNPVIREFGFKEIVVDSFSVAVVAASIARLLPKSGKLRFNFLAFTLAILSLTLVWTVTLAVSNYVVYGVPPHRASLAFPIIVGGVFAASCVASTALTSCKSWPRFLYGLSIAILVGAVAFIASIYLTQSVQKSSVRIDRQSVF